MEKRFPDEQIIGICGRPSRRRGYPRSLQEAQHHRADLFPTAEQVKRDDGAINAPAEGLED